MFASLASLAIFPAPMNLLISLIVGAFCSGGAAHGARDLDATSEERRLGRGIWRGGHGKHFRRANDERSCEVHDLAGWHFLRAHIRVVGFVCASGYWWGERVPA